MSNLTLLIPAHKEAEALPEFLKELEKYEYKKLIVLQKEDLETIDAIKNFKGIEIFTQNRKGYGNALIEGINSIQTEFFCIINADGSMDPSYLNQMLNKCQDIDFVYTSRYLKNGGSDDDNLITFIGNKVFSKLGQIFFDLNISDILYTYVLGKTKSAQNLFLNYGDFRICVELPIKTHRKRYKYSSLPSKERKRIGGVKKVNAIKDGFLILLAMIFLYFNKKKN